MDDFDTFIPFPKMGRLVRSIVVTEKIDGTNAQVVISNDGERIRAASRNQWISPGKTTDNYGFAGWVEANADELKRLGPGRHYGEWWGPGIQRGYGLAEKKFSLFNTGRWSDAATRPSCCDVVPVLYAGMFSEFEIETCLDSLAAFGSRASPGFMRPEGVVVFHSATNTLFKRTLEKDEQPKGLAA